MSKDKNLMNVLKDIAMLPSFDDPLFYSADDSAWQHQLQLEQQQQEEEEDGGNN